MLKNAWSNLRFEERSWGMISLLKEHLGNNHANEWVKLKSEISIRLAGEKAQNSNKLYWRTWAKVISDKRRWK